MQKYSNSLWKIHSENKMQGVQLFSYKNNRGKSKGKSANKRNISKMKLKESDLVLCKVKNIEGATVFVEIEDNGTGSIVVSEIAAGRIRNLRDFVSTGKKIVCKVLKVSSDNIELSLRRVTAKERESVLEKHQKETTLNSILKTIVKDSKVTLEKIKLDRDVSDFMEEARENPKIVSEYLTKSESEKFLKVLSEKREKEKIVKKCFTLKSISPSGLSDIKFILSPYNSQILYLGSSNFSLTLSAPNYKDAEAQAESILSKIEEKAKAKFLKFESKDKK